MRKGSKPSTLLARSCDICDGTNRLKRYRRRTLCAACRKTEIEKAAA